MFAIMLTKLTFRVSSIAYALSVEEQGLLLPNSIESERMVITTAARIFQAASYTKRQLMKTKAIQATIRLNTG
jgi:hypothetical protein